MPNYSMTMAVVVSIFAVGGGLVYFLCAWCMDVKKRDLVAPIVGFTILLVTNWGIAVLNIPESQRAQKQPSAFEYYSPDAVAPRYFSAEEINLVNNLLQEQHGKAVPLFKD